MRSQGYNGERALPSVDDRRQSPFPFARFYTEPPWFARRLACAR